MFPQEYNFQGYVKRNCMHELKIAEDLLSIVTDVARENELEKVTKVYLSFGQMVQIVPEIFETAFEVAVQGTVAEGASADIEIIPLRLKCRSCGQSFIPGEKRFECQTCGSSDIDIINGNEIFVKSIEGE